MKAILIRLVGIGVVVSLSALGCQVSPDAYPDLEPSSQTLRGEQAGAHVKLRDDATPNPVGVTGLRARSEVYTPRHFAELEQGCEGFTTRRPALTVATAEARSAIEITGHGELEFIIIHHPDGSVTCIREPASPEVEPLSLGAGTHQIHAGIATRHQYFRYGVDIEDRQQPLTIPWLDPTTVPVADEVAANGSPLQWPVEFNSDLPFTIPPMQDHPECLDGDYTVASRPAGRLALPEARELKLAALSAGDTPIVIVGPVTEDGRDVQTHCISERSEEWRFDAGDHLIYVAFQSEGAPPFAEVLIDDAKTGGDPTFLARPPEESLPVDARRLEYYYPFISARKLWFSDSLRARFFAMAPRALFAAIAEDIDEPRWLVAADSSSDDTYRTGEQAAVRAGEIVLPIDTQGHVLTVDGLIFAPDPASITAIEGADATQSIDEPRRLWLSLSEQLSLATGDDRSRIDDYHRRHQRYEFCREDIYAEVDAEIEALEAQGASTVEIDDLVDRTESRVRRECEFAILQREDAALHDLLRRSRTQRRHQSLQYNQSRVVDWFSTP